MSGTSPPRVSVSVVTYGHEEYLPIALEGALGQTFRDLEVVVGVDRSEDGTLEVARSFAARDPRVRVLEPEAERLGGRRNFLRTFAATRGELVAWLDGDDAWTGRDKLAAQVDFLDSHPECSGCFHATREVDEAGRPLRGLCEPPGAKPLYGPDDVARQNPTHSVALVHRRSLLVPFPEWLPRTPTADWPVLAHLSKHGPLGYLPFDWAVHRVHARGVWCGLDAERQDESRRATREYFEREILGPDHADAIAMGRDRDLLQLARAHERAGRPDRALSLMRELAERGAPGRSVPRLRFWRRFARLRLRSLSPSLRSPL